MKVAFLIIDYVPHQVQTIKNLIEIKDAEVMSFHVEELEKNIPKLLNFNSFKYKELKKEEIFQKILDFNPDLVITAGWMISEYIWVCKNLLKLKKFPIVAQSDTQWYGKRTQKVNAFISPLHLKKAFSHLWVAGYYQYEYGKKLGFSNNQILFNSLSANVDLFKEVDISIKERKYPKNLLYIGRFSPEKGILNLLEAWNNIKDKKGWTLTFVGRGNLKKDIRSTEGVIVKDYMSQENLILEMQHSGAFILPSTFEPWALVLHEAASAGLPIICTEVCGASPYFVIENYNGFKIQAGSSKEIKESIGKLISKDDNELIQFSKNSRLLGDTINPKLSIANLLQVL